MKWFTFVSLDENDRKLLIILIVIFVILFILLGFIGMAIRATMRKQGKRIDTEVGEATRTLLIPDAPTFKRYAEAKNRRIYCQQTAIPLLVALLSTIIYLVSASLTNQFGVNLFGEFGTLFYRFDWANPDNFANFFGLTLPCRWPPLVQDAYGGLPVFLPEYWLAYTVVPLWLFAIGAYLVVTGSYVARHFRINQCARQIYDQKLDTFNYYDALQGTPTPGSNPAKKDGDAPVPPITK